MNCFRCSGSLRCGANKNKTVTHYQLTNVIDVNSYQLNVCGDLSFLGPNRHRTVGYLRILNLL